MTKTEMGRRINRAIRCAAAVLIALPAAAALLLTAGTLRGDGWTWSALPAYITAERLADRVVDNDPRKLDDVIFFTGIGPTDELAVRHRLTALREQGVVITDGWSRLRHCMADDGVQELSVFFSVEADSAVYTVEFPGSLRGCFGGKAMLRHPLVKNALVEYVQPEWAAALADALCTHDPG